MTIEKRTLGSAIFTGIDSNPYLRTLYARLLKGYGLSLFNLNQRSSTELFNVKEKTDILRFADILSKSNDPEKADVYKIWAQEIAILMHEMYPQDSLVNLYAGDVFSSV